jgi:hypothetical protein
MNGGSAWALAGEPGGRDRRRDPISARWRGPSPASALIAVASEGDRAGQIMATAGVAGAMAASP